MQAYEAWLGPELLAAEYRDRFVDLFECCQPPNSVITAGSGEAQAWAYFTSIVEAWVFRQYSSREETSDVVLLPL